MPPVVAVLYIRSDSLGAITVELSVVEFKATLGISKPLFKLLISNIAEVAGADPSLVIEML